MKTIDVLLINETGAKIITIDNDYKAINKALGWCDAWNTPTISVCSRKYIAICSDTGKLRHERVSALALDNIYCPKETLQETFLVGTIIITKFDGIDDYESLTQEDQDILLSCLIQPKQNDLCFPDVLMLDY